MSPIFQRTAVYIQCFQVYHSRKGELEYYFCQWIRRSHFIDRSLIPIESSVVHYTLLFSDILKTALNRPCFGGGAKTILFDFTSINVKTPEWSGIWSVIMIKRMINRTWRLQPGAIGTIFNGLTDA